MVIPVGVLAPLVAPRGVLLLLLLDEPPVDGPVPSFAVRKAASRVAAAANASRVTGVLSAPLTAESDLDVLLGPRDRGGRSPSSLSLLLLLSLSFDCFLLVSIVSERPVLPAGGLEVWYPEMLPGFVFPRTPRTVPPSSFMSSSSPDPDGRCC